MRSSLYRLQPRYRHPIADLLEVKVLDRRLHHTNLDIGRGIIGKKLGLLQETEHCAQARQGVRIGRPRQRHGIPALALGERQHTADLFNSSVSDVWMGNEEH